MRPSVSSIIAGVLFVTGVASAGLTFSQSSTEAESISTFTFAAEPNGITRPGQEVTLSWQVQGGLSYCEGLDGFEITTEGAEQSKGSKVINVADTKIFSMDCVDDKGIRMGEKSVKIELRRDATQPTIEVPTVIQFRVYPRKVPDMRTPIQVSWEAMNTDACTLVVDDPNGSDPNPSVQRLAKKSDKPLVVMP